MQKYVITIENVQKDMRARLRNQVILEIVGILGGWLMALAVAKIFELFGGNIPFWIIHGVALAGIVLYAVLVVMKLSSIKNERFLVVRDFVVDKITPAPNLWYDGVLHAYAYTPYRLVFAREGKVSLCRHMDFYKWTGCPRNDKTVFDIANIGDSFILVTLNQKVWVVYNERFFDISETVTVLEK